MIIIYLFIIILIVYVIYTNSHIKKTQPVDWNWIYVSRDRSLPGTPPFIRFKYVNDDRKTKAIKGYYKWLRSYDEFRYMWE